MIVKHSVRIIIYKSQNINFINMLKINVIFQKMYFVPNIQY